MKTIITISREFGSGGRFIGETLAKELNFTFYDKNIIEQVAKETGFSKEYIAERGEYAPTHNRFSYSFVGRNAQGGSVDDYIYQKQRNIIRDIAEKGNCVIVGRCADYILQERTDVLNVFIHGNEEEKCQRIMKLCEKSRKEALAMMKDTDKKRSINYAYHTEQKWGETRNYALCMNSSILGYETCMELIKKSME